MTVYVALLRGINVGTAKRMAMADLRALLEGLGYEGVRTHINSGNAVFRATGSDTKIEKDISAGIERVMKMDVAVLVRSTAQLDKLVGANPFVKKKVDPKQLSAVFLSKRPAAGKVSALDPAEYSPDEFTMGDGVIYVRQPNGTMGSKLPDWQKVLGVTITARNWAVTTKLRDLARDL